MLLTNCNVWIHNKPTDMRKAINGLSHIVVTEIKQQPAQGGIFVFWNRARDKIKILYWHVNGFCLFYKRLEKQKFIIPTKLDQTLLITSKELLWLLDGLDFINIQGHRNLRYDALF